MQHPINDITETADTEREKEAERDGGAEEKGTKGAEVAQRGPMAEYDIIESARLFHVTKRDN